MRYPVEYVIVYRDTCLRSFGTSCPAVLGGDVTDKCFNTINTCPVKNSYNRGTHRDVFYNPDNFISTIVTPAVLGQDFEAAYPFLHRTSHRPATINPAGGDSGSGPLGTRATLNITLMDGRSNDRLQDKYFTQRISGAAQLDSVGYQPDERSTFLIKYLARNPYLYARRVDWVTGYIKDGEVVGKKTRTFVIKNVGNVDERGTLSIECQDPLFLTNIKHAKVPREEGRALKSDLGSDVSGSIPLSQWSSYGFISQIQGSRYYWYLGGEVIVSYRDPESPNVEITRGALGSEIQSHNEGDAIQQVWWFANQGVEQIIETLLTLYTNINEVGDFLDIAQWGQVVNQYDWLQHKYTGYITEPTSVAELLEDIAEQMYFYPYWNEEAAKIHLAANVPAPPVAELQFSKLIDEHSNIVADSLRIKPQHNRVFTRVNVHHGVRNWAENLDDTKNYKSVQSFIDLEQEDDNHRRSVTSKDVYGYFLDGTLAAELGENIHELYKNPPLELQFSLDAKDSDLKLAQFFRLKTRLVTNTMGEEMELAAQVTSVREAVTGSKWDYKAIALNFGVGTHARPNVWPILIAEDMTNVNVKNIFDATYPTYTPRSGDRIIVTVASGVIIGATDTSTPAIDFNFPQAWVDGGVEIQLAVSAETYVLGRGGRGGNGGYARGSTTQSGYDAQDGRNGEDGGAAISTTCVISLTNNGVIGGGGGGGGGSGGATDFNLITQGAVSVAVTGASGGGGGGVVEGAPHNRGEPGVFSNPHGALMVGHHIGSVGESGQLLTGGDGGAAKSYNDGSRSEAYSGASGRGGDVGQNGSSGGIGTRRGGSSGIQITSGGQGGQAGAAISGMAPISIDGNGQILGSTP